MTANSYKQINSDDLRTVIATSMDGFLQVGMDGTIIEVNDSYCQLVGYSREQLLNMHLSSVDADGSNTDVAQRMEQTVQTGALRFETKHRHQNGTIIDIEASANYSSAHGGSVFFFVRAISFQKRNREIIEARLRLIEYSHKNSLCELLRETLDEAEKLTGSCIGFYHFMDANTQILTLQAWSTKTAAEFCKAEGAGSHYPVAQAGVWVDCIHERRPVIHNDYASLPHRKGLPEGHAAVVRELVVPIFRVGNIVAILGVGNKQTDYDRQDVEVITVLADLAWEVVERKKAEEELKKSEVILNSSQHLAKVGGWQWDIAHQSMIWTEETYRIHDVEPGSIILGSSKHIEQSLNCYDPEDRQTVMSAFQCCVEQGEEYDLELPFTTAAGRRLWIRTTAKPVWHEDRVVKVIGNIMDITERKQAEKKLLEQNVELERFNYSVSHDLKSPLITIQGFASRVNKHLERGDITQARENMTLIEGAASKMMTLLNDLLKLSSGGTVMNPPSEIDMNQLVKEVLALLAGPLGQNNIEVVVQTDLPSVKGDMLRVSQIVQNLVENAVKYMGDQTAPRIEVGTRQDGKENVFFVRDNGKGIEPRFHEHIFGLFTKLDDASEGTGIGLALVKRIIEVHGGRIWVESDGEGNGSRFCFTVGRRGD